MKIRLAQPHWLHTLVITGREENDDPYERDDKGEIKEEDGEKVLKDGWELDENDEPVKVDDGGNPDDDNDKDEVTKLQERADALEESLRRERTLRRKAEREARKSAKKKPGDKPGTGDDETQKKLEQQEARTARLAEGFLNSKIDAAIEAEARKQGFIDPTDALTDAIRRAVDADQDEEDPTDIEVDFDSVKDAVADLAARKKHLVGKGTPSEKSGGKFRRKTGGNDDGVDGKVLEEHYPSLR